MGLAIWRTSSAQFIGIIVDELISFKGHIEEDSNKLDRNVCIIRKLKHCFMKEKEILMLYFGLIPTYFFIVVQYVWKLSPSSSPSFAIYSY